VRAQTEEQNGHPGGPEWLLQRVNPVEYTRKVGSVQKVIARLLEIRKSKLERVAAEPDAFVPRLVRCVMV
jgi:hypothetical protein